VGVTVSDQKHSPPADNNDHCDNNIGSNSAKKALFQSTAKANKKKRDKNDDTPYQGGQKKNQRGGNATNYTRRTRTKSKPKIHRQNDKKAASDSPLPQPHLPSTGGSPHVPRTLSYDNESQQTSTVQNVGERHTAKKYTMTKAILQLLRPDIFRGKEVAWEEYRDDDEIRIHDKSVMENASNSFHHHNVELSKVKRGYLTNNLSNCRRLHLEDMLTQYDGDSLIPFRVLISKSSENNEWAETARKIYRQQRNEGMKLGVETRKIMGIAYLELYASLVPNERHKSIKGSCLSKKEIENLLLSDEGFEIRFEGMPEDFAMKFEWSDMVDSPLDLMIFGAKDAAPRLYSSLFKNKSNPIYIHFIYRELALETRGDGEATLALTSAYHLKNSVVFKENAVKSIAKAEKEIIESMTFTGDAKKEDYFAKVDKAFEGTLRNCLVTFQDYNAILLPKELLIDFMEEAQVIFKTAWKALSNMRGIKEDHERYADLVPAKQFRVFFQLLSLARQANDKRLIHWAFVQAMASYAWGIPTKAQNIDACWGHTCSSRTRDRKMLELVDDLLSRQMKVLSCCAAVINVYDNYQRGKRLKSQSPYCLHH